MLTRRSTAVADRRRGPRLLVALGLLLASLLPTAALGQEGERELSEDDFAWIESVANLPTDARWSETELDELRACLEREWHAGESRFRTLGVCVAVSGPPIREDAAAFAAAFTNVLGTRLVAAVDKKRIGLSEGQIVAISREYGRCLLGYYSIVGGDGALAACAGDIGIVLTEAAVLAEAADFDLGDVLRVFCPPRLSSAPGQVTAYQDTDDCPPDAEPAADTPEAPPLVAVGGGLAALAGEYRGGGAIAPDLLLSRWRYQSPYTGTLRASVTLDAVGRVTDAQLVVEIINPLPDPRCDKVRDTDDSRLLEAYWIQFEPVYASTPEGRPEFIERGNVPLRISMRGEHTDVYVGAGECSIQGTHVRPGGGTFDLFFVDATTLVMCAGETRVTCAQNPLARLTRV